MLQILHRCSLGALVQPACTRVMERRIAFDELSIFGNAPYLACAHVHWVTRKRSATEMTENVNILD